MGRIYRSARMILVRLGEDADSSDNALSIFTSALSNFEFAELMFRRSRIFKIGIMAKEGKYLDWEDPDQARAIDQQALVSRFCFPDAMRVRYSDINACKDDQWLSIDRQALKSGFLLAECCVQTSGA